MTPIPGARRYSIDLSDDPPTIYTAAGHPRRPNHKNAVAIWCDDGIRRCRTLRRWALLTQHRDRLIPLFRNSDARSAFIDRLALDDF